LGAGGKAFFVKNGILYVACGSQAKRIMSVKDIPVTLKGIALHNIQNALVAAAACYCCKIPLAYIKKGLAGFDQNPGRLTIMHINGFRVCIDYGHNPAGYQALINTVQHMGAKRLVGVIAAPGDRRDDVIINIGRIAGRGFHIIYIKEDADLRGRQSGEVAGLLRQGVLESGLGADKIRIMLPEYDAVQAALENARLGDMIVVFYETYNKVIAAVQNFCQLEKNQQEIKEKNLALIRNG
jgi:cyanophycin synthetase